MIKIYGNVRETKQSESGAWYAKVSSLQDYDRGEVHVVKTGAVELTVGARVSFNANEVGANYELLGGVKKYESVLTFDQKVAVGNAINVAFIIASGDQQSTQDLTIPVYRACEEVREEITKGLDPNASKDAKIKLAEAFKRAAHKYTADTFDAEAFKEDALSWAAMHSALERSDELG